MFETAFVRGRSLQLWHAHATQSHGQLHSETSLQQSAEELFPKPWADSALCMEPFLQADAFSNPSGGYTLRQQQAGQGWH